MVGTVVEDEILQVREVHAHIVHAARVQVGQEVQRMGGLVLLLLLVLLVPSIHVQQGRGVQVQVVQVLKVLDNFSCKN